MLCFVKTRKNTSCFFLTFDATIRPCNLLTYPSVAGLQAHCHNSPLIPHSGSWKPDRSIFKSATCARILWTAPYKAILHKFWTSCGWSARKTRLWFRTEQARLNICTDLSSANSLYAPHETFSPGGPLFLLTYRNARNHQRCSSVNTSRVLNVSCQSR